MTRIAAEAGVTLMQDEAILFLEPAEIDAHDVTEEEDVDLDHIRPDLAELIARHAITLDENRPASVERRRKTNQRTARENIAQLVDDGSFVEYGSLAIAAQRRRRKVDDLIHNTPADGLISGVATVNADRFGPEGARCMVISYDYTVLAGTQGHMNHKKIDRMLGLAEQWRMPLVFYAEGGGGRPGDTDRLGMTGLDGPSFVQFAKLSGLVPGDDRRRRPRRLSSGRGRPGVVPVAERGDRYPRRGRSRSHHRRAEIPVLFPGRGRRLESAGPAAVAAGDPGEPPAGL